MPEAAWRFLYNRYWHQGISEAQCHSMQHAWSVRCDNHRSSEQLIQYKLLVDALKTIMELVCMILINTGASNFTESDNNQLVVIKQN